MVNVGLALACMRSHNDSGSMGVEVRTRVHENGYPRVNQLQ